jgi:hypothetical protein
MDRIFGRAEIGRKNIVLGIALFLVLGVAVGIPLTINMFGGSVLSSEAYGTWKVIHGYGVFLGVINYFFGSIIDGLALTRQQKEIASWSVAVAGLVGGAGRMTLLLLGVLADFGRVASLAETMFMVLGIGLFLLGQARRAGSGSTS